MEWRKRCAIGSTVCISVPAVAELLADCLERALRDPDLWERLRRRIRPPPSAAECAAAHVALYDQLRETLRRRHAEQRHPSPPDRDEPASAIAACGRGPLDAAWRDAVRGVGAAAARRPCRQPAAARRPALHAADLRSGDRFGQPGHAGRPHHAGARSCSSSSASSTMPARVCS